MSSSSVLLLFFFPLSPGSSELRSGVFAEDEGLGPTLDCLRVTQAGMLLYIYLRKIYSFLLYGFSTHRVFLDSILFFLFLFFVFSCLCVWGWTYYGFLFFTFYIIIVGSFRVLFFTDRIEVRK